VEIQAIQETIVRKPVNIHATSRTTGATTTTDSTRTTATTKGGTQSQTSPSIDPREVKISIIMAIISAISLPSKTLC
jgi:hypothetical protein